MASGNQLERAGPDWKGKVIEGFLLRVRIEYLKDPSGTTVKNRQERGKTRKAPGKAQKPSNRSLQGNCTQGAGVSGISQGSQLVKAALPPTLPADLLEEIYTNIP